METITINKREIISALKKNKAQHIKDYKRAVKEYGKIARKQLKDFEKALDKGQMGMSLKLTTPVNNASKYDKLINMFELEISDTIELTRGQFNEFMYDEFSWAQNAMYLNTSTWKTPGVYSMEAGVSSDL